MPLFGQACLAAMPNLTAENDTRQWFRADRRPEWKQPADDLESLYYIEPT
jgi:hypothetical protein